jgi:hypothetical protein
VRSWGHVQMFSPWKYNTDSVAVDLLQKSGWNHPEPEHFPTGMELVTEYLEPLSSLTALANHISYDAQVIAVTRLGYDKVKTGARSDAPFLIYYRDADGVESSVLASAVLDTSGTVGQPNPLGTGGISAIGESDLHSRITYGVPDLLGVDRARYAGKRVLVVGSGDSAFNSLINLVTLRTEAPETEILWAVRRAPDTINFGGGAQDALPERGALGARVQALVEHGGLRLISSVHITKLELVDEAIKIDAGSIEIPPVDEIVAVTGYRPDLDMIRELRLSLDPIVESPAALAPLIDPNLHSCGTVPPHGVEELTHPESRFYIAGMKSYGRAPTFLMLTGYEQVRSIIAALAGDWEAAKNVQLVLPETGVCSSAGQVERIPVGVGATSCCSGCC